MSFTYGTIWGDYGDEKVTSTSEDFGVTIGTRLVLPDGRVFRYAFSNGAAGSGTGVQSSAALGNHDSNLGVSAAAAVGSKSASITLGSTAAAEDLYANGYLFFNTAAGSGQVYRIRQHDAIGSGGTGTINLMDGDAIVEALTTSSKAGLVANPYMHVIPSPGGAQTGRTVGFAPRDVADDSYFWAQTWGEAAVEADGTLVIFRPIRMSDGQAGAVENYASQTASEEQVVGFATNVIAADEHFQFAFLTIGA
jgi:hypothetical protein